MKKVGISLLFGLLLLGSYNDSFAQSKKKEKKRIEQEKKVAQEKEKARKDSLAKITPFDKLLSKPDKVAKGFINIYEAKKKTYLELPLSLLDKDLLLASTISEISDNYEGIVGAKHQPLLIQFSLVDSTVLLKKMTDIYETDSPDNNIAKALKLNSIGAILKSFKTEAFGNDGKSVVIDVTDFFNSEMKEISPFGIYSVYASMGYKSTPSFKKDRSFIASFKSFDDNLIIKSQLSYENSYNNGTRTFAKDIPVTATVTRSIVRLSEQAVRPRIADYRVGVFYTQKTLMSEQLNRTENIYFAHRFNLEPKDRTAYANGQLTEPVNPIVFYVDNAFPKEWQPYIKKAVEDWQQVFEKAGFKNAIIAKDFPINDPTFDPDNIKYNCIRYAPVPVANAMGPSWVDPRSGEIINASVYVFHDIVKVLNNWLFVQTSPADKEVRNPLLPEKHKLEGLQYVIRHEIGHCIGLRHNMGASNAIPVDSLRSPTFTQQYGTTYSIMDYARYNYVAQPGDKERGVALAPPTFGLYDYYAIDWNYRYYDPSRISAAQEKNRLADMVKEKITDVRYRFGNEFLTGFDPRTQTEDLGDNAMKAATYGIKNLKYVLDNLDEWVKGKDYDYSYRQTILAQVRGQFTRYINHVLANVGGIEINDKYEGDPIPHYKVVSKAKQREALQFILNQLNDIDWLEPEELVKNITITGTPLVALRNNIVRALLESPYRVALGALRTDEKTPYTPEEVLEDLYQSFWKPTIQRSKLTTAQMQMQKSFVNTILTKSQLVPATPAGATGVALQSATLPVLQIEIDEKETASCSMGLYHNHTEAMNSYGRGVVKGFGYPTVNFNMQPTLEPVYFGLIKRIQTLLRQAIAGTRDQETVQHYRLLQHQLDKALK